MNASARIPARSPARRRLTDLSSAAWLNVPAKLTGTALSFLLYVALARWMSTASFGRVALMLAWLAIASSIASLSMPLVVVRHVSHDLAAGRLDRAKAAFRYAQRSTVLVSAVLAAAAIGLVATGAVGMAGEPADVVITALLLVPSVMVLVHSGLLQAFKRVVGSELLTNTMRPVLLLAILGAVHAVRPDLVTVRVVLGAYLAVTLVLLAALAAAARRTRPAGWAAAAVVDNRREVRHSAMGFMAVMLAAALAERIDILLLGWTAPPTEVAAYAVATRFSQATIVAVNAISAVMAPHLVEQLTPIRAGRLADAQSLVRGTARRTIVVTLLALLSFGILGPWLATLFGPQYGGAYLPLMLLTLGQVTAALFGPAALVATLTGSSSLAVGSLVVGIAVNAALNLLLVPRVGAVGAAAATAVATTVAAMLAWYGTRRRLGIDASVVASTMASTVAPAAREATAD